MDMDKIIIFVKAVGFPVAVSIWFLWKIQVFMDALLVSQTTLIELTRQLIDLHK
jgi:hypothetical protein